MAVHLYINGILVDLYKDEAITLTSKLKDFKDVTQAYGDFSQEFSIPASGHNNDILNRFADGEIIDSNHYINYKAKVPATIDIDGTKNIDGYITYNKCLYKDNIMDSHVLAFTSALLSIGKIVGDDLLNSLNYSIFNHPNNPSTVGVGLTSYVPSGDYNDGTSSNGDLRYSLMTNNDVEWTTDYLNTGIDSSEFRPSLKVDAFFKLINEKYDLDFSLTYKDNYPNLGYDNLFMWCGNKNDSQEIGNAISLPDDSSVMWYKIWDWAKDDTPYNDEWVWKPNDGIFGFKSDVIRIPRFKYTFNITPHDLLTEYHVSIYGVNNNDSIGNRLVLFPATGALVDYSIIITNQGDWLNYEQYVIVLSSPTGVELTFDYDIEWDTEYSGRAGSWDFGEKQGFKANNANITTTPYANKMGLRVPNMKIIDFIKGFMTLYNCVLYPDDNNRDSYLMETYEKWRQFDDIIDFTNETNIDSHTVTIPKVPKTLRIEYANPKAIKNKLFTDIYGVGYGDYKNQGGEGDDYNIKLPFENMIYDLVVGGTNPTDEYLIGRAVSNESTYNETDDRFDGLTGVYDVPFLQLLAPSEITNCNINITKAATASTLVTSYNLFNSYSDYNPLNDEPTHTLNFYQEYDYWSKVRIYETNLYNLVYDDYLELFLNPTVRLYNHKAVLSPVALHELSLHKTLQIKDKFFTINSYKYNSKTKETELELVRYLRDYNDITETLPTDNVAPEVCSLDVIPNPVPTAPTNLSASDITHDKAYQFTLRWDLSTSLTNTIDKYEIFKNGELYATQEDGTRDTYDISGLPLEYTANWTVQAVDDLGLRSEFSLPLEVTTASVPGPEFNEPITLDLATPNSLDISWLPATSEVSPIQYYEIYVDNVLIGTRFVGDDLEVSIDGLTPSTEYSIFILAYEKAIDCDCGNFAQSNTVQFSTLLPVAFNNPVSLDSATSDSITINWLPATPGYPLDYYQVYIDGLLNGTVDANDPLTYTFDELDYSTEYEIYVVVTDISGAKSESALVYFDTLGPLGPTFNDPITFGIPTDTTVMVNWLPATAGDNPLSHYTISGVPSLIVDPGNIPLTENNVELTGLLPNTTYIITMEIYDSILNSDTSVSKSFTTADLPINIPMIIEYTPTSPGQVLKLKDTNLLGSINWGDGTPTQMFGGTTVPIEHTYVGYSTYQVEIQGSMDEFMFDDGITASYVTNILQWGGLEAKHLSFWSCSGLTSISAGGQPTFVPNQSLATMFQYCNSLQNWFALSTWDTTNVVDMSYMFASGTDMNPNVSSWNVSNVTNFDAMFSGNETFDRDISGWNTSSATSMGNGMFFDCQIFNADISGWDTSNVTNMQGMFNRAYIFNQPIGLWNTSNVTTMQDMFVIANAFNQDLSNWDTGKVTSMNQMFSGSLTTFNQDISMWDVSSLEDAALMFYLSGSFSDENYGLLLNGWASQVVKPNVPFTLTNAKYNPIYQSDRDILTNAPNNWIITDLGPI